MTDETEAKAVMLRKHKHAEACLAEDSRLGLSAACMLSARRLYEVARQKLYADLSDEDIAKFIASNVAMQASQPFSDSALRDEISKIVVPFMAMLVSENSKSETEKAKQDAKTESNNRLAMPVHFLKNHEPVTRKQTLLLFGNDACIDTCLASIAEHVQISNDPVFVTIRMLQTVGAPTQSMAGDKRYFEIGSSKTMGIADTRKGFDSDMSILLRQMYKNRLDVLIVDDLISLTTETTSTASALSRAEHANKVIRRWADAAGCVVIAGVRSPDVTADATNWGAHAIFGNVDESGNISISQLL